MKRKFLASICAAAMVLSMGMPVMAASDDSGNTTSFTGDDSSFGGNATIDVNSSVSKSDGTVDETVAYNVTVSWEMTPGAYSSEGDVYSWNPESLRYEKTTSSTKDTLTKTADASVKITVTNKSNAAVDYAITYASEKNGDKEISTQTITNSSAASGTLDNAAPEDSGLTGSPDVGTTTGTATSATYTATVGFNENAVSSTAVDTMKMGTYTVSISKETTESN